MSNVEVGERSAASLVGQYVKVKSSLPGGEVFGFFTEAFEEDTGGGWVYVFSQQRYVPVAASHCTPVPTWDLTGGFKNVPVAVVGFGVGVIYEEDCQGGGFRVKVENDRGLKTTVSFSRVQLRLPLRR